MNHYRTKDGRTLTWTGQGVCICTHCDEIFGSVSAFDHHLKTRKTGHQPHDHSDMPRNNRGHKVITLWEDGQHHAKQ